MYGGEVAPQKAVRPSWFCDRVSHWAGICQFTSDGGQVSPRGPPVYSAGFTRAQHGSGAEGQVLKASISPLSPLTCWPQSSSLVSSKSLDAGQCGEMQDLRRPRHFLDLQVVVFPPKHHFCMGTFIQNSHYHLSETMSTFLSMKD